MEWPPQSPDLNPIEQLWDHLDSVLRQNPQTNEESTWKFLEKAWSEIAKETLTTYIYSMRKRCQAVIDAAGGHTKY